ncbi:MAG: hypothetical protein JO184_07915 [Gammaproteobacteria bacterium]|nr:hypothetical protein [Gammaproteobacteria bacterium]MBV8403843.1 hypothetical protein [Gammaproteobacteria bacterium]
MRNLLWLALAGGLLFSLESMGADGSLKADSKQVSTVEDLYAEVSDANTILATIDSGLLSRYQGKDRAAWQRFYISRRAELGRQLDSLPTAGLSGRDARAVAAMRKQMQGFTGGGALFSPAAKCPDAARRDIPYPQLKSALVACFTEIGNSLSFEGGKINRVSALDLLHETADAARRKAVFLAFVPLWQAINGNNEPDSPYRRMIAGAATEAAKSGSEIDNAARDVGIDTGEVERWLVQMLEAWRESSGDAAIEPWDFRFQGSEADRLLGAYIPRAALQPINQRYYRDLGADLEQLGTLYDLAPRPDKAALAYTEFVTHGRIVHGAWWPTVARVSAPYERGGLFVLNELVHENGHVANITAIRNRPAFVDWPSDLFAEAFADVPAWSTYEPAWQRRYLGHEAPEQLSLRALYSVVVLDVAWSLFELRMFRAPTTDPNALWTDITSRYLHIVPHPEFSWWAMRVQLADLPGYMVNYGLGAVLTAEMRRHIADALGGFDTGDPRWYRWLSEHLLRYGSERDTRELMQDFLGRPVSPQAFLEQIHRLKPLDNGRHRAETARGDGRYRTAAAPERDSS